VPGILHIGGYGTGDGVPVCGQGVPAQRRVPLAMSQIEGARRSSARDGLLGIGFVPVASKLYRPTPGLVARRSLLADVRRRDGDVVTVTAPAGYGKSTFVAELSTADPRPTAWLSLTATENDPAALLTYVALAIDEIEPVDPACVAALWQGRPVIGSLAWQQFVSMLAGRRRPFTLVLDDVHELVGRDVLDALPVLAAELPPGATLVLVGRTGIPLPLGRLRVRRRLVEVGPAELAFDEDEAALLFGGLGIDVPPDAVRQLVARTEGWPVALYLAALARAGGRPAAVEIADDFTGDHRFLVDYLGEELLADLAPDVAAFLLDASCLDRLSGSLCDDVLGRSGSAQLLEQLRRSDLLVMPLDDRRQWYRFHHLMAEFLQSELARQDPSRRRTVHRRASDWYHDHGDGERAIRHAVLGGDLDRAEALVLHWSSGVAGGGTCPTVDRWLALFPPDDLVARPGLMVTAAHGRFRAGDGGAAVQWLDRASAALADDHPTNADGSVATVLLAAGRAVIAPLAPAEMLREARYAHAHAGLGEGHPLACLAMGVAHFMLGDEAEAVRRLGECIAAPLQRPLVQASALAQLAVIEADRGHWDEATALATRARGLLGPAITVPTGNLVLAMSVLVEARERPGDAVERDRQLCARHLEELVGTATWLNLQARVALARAAHVRGAHVDAARLLDEVDAILATTPGAVRVEAQAAALRRTLAAARDRSRRFGPASLTAAELRVLRLLPTHLSVAEIADRLYVSRNTVKSQTIAIYRKLGTSSRSGAVGAAVVAGLLDAGAGPA
jgi:LuxR family maltose regulon positive regulatory protein